MGKERNPEKYPEQLRDAAFTVVGEEPLAKKPISVRLYQADDTKLRPLGKQYAVFIREAVREKIERDNN